MLSIGDGLPPLGLLFDGFEGVICTWIFCGCGLLRRVRSRAGCHWSASVGGQDYRSYCASVSRLLSFSLVKKFARQLKS